MFTPLLIGLLNLSPTTTSEIVSTWQGKSCSWWGDSTFEARFSYQFEPGGQYRNFFQFFSEGRCQGSPTTRIRNSDGRWVFHQNQGDPSLGVLDLFPSHLNRSLRYWTVTNGNTLKICRAEDRSSCRTYTRVSDQSMLAGLFFEGVP